MVRSSCENYRDMGYTNRADCESHTMSSKTMGIQTSAVLTTRWSTTVCAKTESINMTCFYDWMDLDFQSFEG